MYRVVGRADCKKRGHKVEVYRVYLGFPRPPPELIEFLCARYAPYSDDSTLVRRCCQHGTRGVDRQEGNGRLVRLDDVRDSE